MQPTVQTIPQPIVISLWPGGAPGSEGWTQEEEESAWPQGGLKVIRNVAQPTLTAYLPDPTSPRHGGDRLPGRSMPFPVLEHEGTDVAEWLNAQGIAAFILKYRLIRTGDDFAAESTSARRPLEVAGPMQALGR